MRKIFIAIPILLFSCTSGINLKSVDLTDLFCDSNSKVWIVNKLIVGNSVISPFEDKDKDVMVFYLNRNCDYVALKDLGRKEPSKGYYLLDSELKTMTVEFKPDSIWDLTLSYITEDSILMKPTKESDIQYGIQLKPFAELNFEVSPFGQ
jgi:hypothetical protein